MRPASARSTTRRAGSRSSPGSSSRRCSPTAASRSWSSPCALRDGEAWGAVGLYGRPSGRCSRITSSRSSGRRRRCSPRAPVTACASPRPASPSCPTHRAGRPRRGPGRHLGIAARGDLARRARRQGRRPARRPSSRSPARPVGTRRLPGPGGVRPVALPARVRARERVRAADRVGGGRRRRPAQLESLPVRAYGLTGRERDVAGLVVRGSSNQLVASALGVAADTVQQLPVAHLRQDRRPKPRRAGRRLLHTHFEPRVRPNQRRTAGGRARRGPAHCDLMKDA